MSSPAPSAFEDFLVRRGLPALLVAVIAFVGYSGALGFDFLHDDFGQIAENPALRSWSSLPQYFTQHSWAGVYTTGGTYYRPFFLLWLRLNYLVFELRPAGWHLVSILCHVGVTLLVYRLVLNLLREREAAFVAALLFGLHPAHIEAVAWVSAVSDLLMTACVLGALLFWMRAAPGDWRRWAAAAALYVAAMLLKETGIVFPALAAALWLVRPARESEAKPAGPTARHWLALLPLPAVYLVLRSRVLHGLGLEGSSASWLQMVLTWPSALLFYARHLLFPFGLGYYYDFSYVSGATLVDFWWPILVLLAGAAVILWLFRGGSGRMAAFALVLVAAPLAPVLYLRAFPADDLVHDRYLYLPSVGFVLLATLLYQKLREHAPRLARAGAAAIALLFFGALIAQQATWANNLVFYSHGVETAPRNLVVMNNLGSEFARRGDPRRAEVMFQRVLARDPNQWLANFNLGYLDYSQHRYQEAEPYFRAAVRLQPGDSESHMYLGINLLQLGQLPEAQANLERALALRPDGYGYREALALVLAARGDRAGARRELQAELALHPDNQRAQRALEHLGTQ